MRFVGFVELEQTIVLGVTTRNGSIVPVNSDTAPPTYMVYADAVPLVNGNTSFHHTGSISSAANNGSGLYRITSTGHGLQTGQRVTITGTSVAADGTFLVTRIDADNFDLQSSTYGSSAATGTWNTTGRYKASIAATTANGYQRGKMYRVELDFKISSTSYGDELCFMVT